MDYFKNYCLLNPLKTIFNFSNKKSLKRKSSASDINVCPRKQKIYMPLGYPRKGKDELEELGATFKSSAHLPLDYGNLATYNNPAITESNYDKCNKPLPKKCEYLGQYYNKLAKRGVAKMKTKSRSDFNVRTYQNFAKRCTYDYDNTETHNPNVIEDIWNNMSLCRKFQYYWLAANSNQISHNAFENFLNFYTKLPKNRKKPINFQKLLYIWKSMSYDEKLPFIFESFLVHIAASPILFKEYNMKLYFDAGKVKLN